MTRISWDELYIDFASLLRKRSTCSRGKVGCVAVRDTRVVASAYNGSLAGDPHCDDIGCDVEANVHEAGCRRTIHAEANLVAFAAKHGLSLDNVTVYATHSPCLKCAQLLVQSGIGELVYKTPYRLTEGLELLITHMPVRALWIEGGDQ